MLFDYLDSNFFLWTFDIYNWPDAGYLLFAGLDLTNTIQGPGIQKNFIFYAASKVIINTSTFSSAVRFLSEK